VHPRSSTCVASSSTMLVNSRFLPGHTVAFAQRLLKALVRTVFDLLHHNGRDLWELPQFERKAMLGNRTTLRLVSRNPGSCSFSTRRKPVRPEPQH
jgi:ATP-dependent DNA ligase